MYINIKVLEMCYVHFDREHQTVSFSLAIQQDECTSAFLFLGVRYFLSVLSCHRQMHKMPFWNIGCQSLCSCVYGGSSVVKFRQRANLKTSTSPAFYWVKTKQISVFSVVRHESLRALLCIFDCPLKTGVAVLKTYLGLLWFPVDLVLAASCTFCMIPFS